ncbi:MAG: PD-(D/E)XK nuclease family protein [Micrococcales bacterium]|nr:PD-(D/E)XK nuclease family protein [Micrococcales bacterium]
MPQPSLSPSRASDFQRCPLLFRFRTIDKLPEPLSPAAMRGRLVHLVLERLFDLPPAQRTSSAAHGLVPSALADLEADEPGLTSLFPSAQKRQSWLNGADQLVESYFYLEDPTALAPEARELWVRTTLDNGLILRGIIDRLDVAPSTGALRIVDYKTSKAPAPRYQGETLFQLRFYSLIIWRDRSVIPAMVQLLYLGSRNTISQVPTAEQLELTETKIRTLWDSIVQMTHRREFPPVKSPLCDWCAHKVLCPLFGGELLPLPEDAAERLGIDPGPTT